VYDLGGGTFDVSIVAIKGDSFSVKAVSGDTHLGGEDFDQRVLEYCIEEFKKETGNDIRGNNRALRRLRIYCEKAKRTLSSAAEADIELDALAEGEDFCLTLTRAKFEDLCKDAFQATLTCVDQALDDAGMRKSDINEVIMVGGSTRILKIQQLVQDHMGLQLNKTVNADEAVAVGATIQSAMLDEASVTQAMYEKVKVIEHKDVTPLSLGIETKGENMSVVLKRNSEVPAKTTKLYWTSADNQTSVCF